jgi:hypothetical protein
VLESQLDDLPAVIDEWLAVWGSSLRAVIASS